MTFNQTHLLVENKYCGAKLQYDWRNYSYNIDIGLLYENHDIKVSDDAVSENKDGKL